jgi:MscS family membrane protein
MGDVVIWVIGIAVAAGIVGQESDATHFGSVPQLRDDGIVVCFAWFLIRLIRNVARNVVVIREKVGVESGCRLSPA